jgi:23S rRNA (adenine2503-C2)-methyltransferase
MKRNLLGMDREELSEFAQSLGESTYRGNQLFHWLYGHGVTDFAGMTNLGKAVRTTLEATALVTTPEEVKRQESQEDGTSKYVFRLADGALIETVLIPPASAFTGKEAAAEDEQQRLTLCVSTQVGCPLDCAFCATGTMGFTRNLTAGEIVGQVLAVRRTTRRKITNVVFMGMGEPLMNYDAVMRAADLFTAGMQIAARHVTISTAGWVEGIRKMGGERRRQKLAVSLHSVTPATRASLMPITRKHDLDALEKALADYYARTKIRITFEFIFFDGINDTDDEVSRLIAFSRRIPSKINVIPFHSIAFTHPRGLGASLRPSRRQDEIVERLREAQITVMVRSNAGEDIDAACGQLVTTVTRPRTLRASHTLPATHHA